MAGPPRHVVMLAFHYPPMVGAASERAASFARHLPEAGWAPTVVTVARGLFATDADNRPPDVPTLRTRSPEPSRLLMPLRRGARTPGAGIPAVGHARALEPMRALVKHYVYMPDGQVLWIPLAIRAARRALREAGPGAVLLSSSVPYSAHLAAREVARSERVPWVAEFRDPWVQMDDRTRPRPRSRKRLDAVLERRIVEAASAIVVTTDATRTAMAASYPAVGEGRFWTVRNGYEALNCNAEIPGSDAPLELVHAGSVSDEIAIEPLLRGVERVARERPGEVRLRAFGPPDRWRIAARGVDADGWLRIEGIVSPVAAREAIAQASATILLRPGVQHDQFLAAKLIEYLGVCRPILGIVSPTGEMAALGRDYGEMRLVDQYTEEAVARGVRNLLDDHRDGRLQGPTRSRLDLSELDRRSQARRLAEVLSAVA